VRYVVFALALSLLAPELMRSVDYAWFNGDQMLYRVIRVLPYVIFAALIYRHCMRMLLIKKHLESALMATIVICMCITSVFDLLMADYHLFYALTDIRNGEGLSWELIYNSVEILILLIIVGKNGAAYLYNMGVCAVIGRYVTIGFSPKPDRDK